MPGPPAPRRPPRRAPRRQMDYHIHTYADDITYEDEFEPKLETEDESERSYNEDTMSTISACTEEFERLPDVDYTSTKPGTISEVKIAYGVKRKGKRNPEWMDEPPARIVNEQAARKDAEQVRSGYAIVHRKLLNRDTGEWETNSIQIISHKLKSFLQNVVWISGPGRPSHKVVTLRPPFKSLFEAAEDFERVLRTEKDHETRMQAELLYEILSDIWKPHREALLESQTSGYIANRSIWTLFPPDTQVVLTFSGQPCVGRVHGAMPCNSKGLEQGVRLDVKVLNWNGSDAAWQDQSRFVMPIMPTVSGTVKVCTLEAYPLTYHEDEDKLREMLIARGRKFERLRGLHFKSYKQSQPGSKLEQRIVVDAYGYGRFGGPHLSPLPPNDIVPIFAASPRIPSPPPPGAPDPINEMLGQYNGKRSKAGYKKKALCLCARKEVDLRPLTDEECLCAVPEVYGFDLQTKIWRKFYIDMIDEISWNQDAFTQLVLGEEQKRLILAFSQYRGEDLDFDDFIPGKGKGMIMLLCGPPGVGKTLTAESLAEELKTPVFRLDVGDAGVEAAKLEEQLQLALEICTHWRAVLLIDEADVFMEARNLDSLQRNELVAVFLRLVEYYNGIMFLTTNRPYALDPAFESRVDLIVQYEMLDSSARLEVWKNFIHKLKPGAHKIGDAELAELSKWKVNGRDIKNLIKTGLVLGKSEGKLLTMEQLQAVWNVRQQVPRAVSSREPRQPRFVV